MRKTFIAILSVFMLVSCGNSNKDSKKTETAQEETVVVEENTYVKNLDIKHSSRKYGTSRTLLTLLYIKEKSLALLISMLIGAALAEK